MNDMNCHICEGEVTEENSRLLFYPDAGMEVRICNGCIEIKIKQAKVRDLEIDFVLDVSALGVRNMAKIH